MPRQQIVPTWLTWNNANFGASSGLLDQRTGQPYEAGGLGLGDYFDTTEQEANSCSFLPNGQLHWGRYRLVQVDSSATQANIYTGAIAFMSRTSRIDGIRIQVQGTGGTPGIYSINLPPELMNGNGAQIRLTVGNSGGLIAATVVNGGMGYLGPFQFIDAWPQWIAQIPGLTGAEIATDVQFTPNHVTSGDQVTTPFLTSFSEAETRAFVFLNSITPGNYGFVQELGLATVSFGPSVPSAVGELANSVPGLSYAVSGSVNQATFGLILGYSDYKGLAKVIMRMGPMVQD